MLIRQGKGKEPNEEIIISAPFKNEGGAPLRPGKMTHSRQQQNQPKKWDIHKI